VRKGETIATIARQLKVKRADLAQANYLSGARALAAGQQLVIPRAPTLLLAAGTTAARMPTTPSWLADTGRGGPTPWSPRLPARAGTRGRREWFTG
jgi:LysM repeat protein